MNRLLSIWDTYIPTYFGYSHLNETIQNEITKKINQLYFGSETIATLNSEKLTEVKNINFWKFLKKLI